MRNFRPVFYPLYPRPLSVCKTSPASPRAFFYRFMYYFSIAGYEVKQVTKNTAQDVQLSLGEIETIKVALMLLLADIKDSGFGDDDMGTMMAEAHKRNVSLILKKLG